MWEAVDAPLGPHQRAASLLALAVVLPMMLIGQERPRALVNAAQQRGALRTAYVEWSMSDARIFSSREMFNTSRFTPTEDALVQRGDREGVLARTEDGSPSKVHTGHHSILARKGESWTYWQDDVGAELRAKREGEHGTWMLRSLGLGYSSSMSDVETTLWRDRVAQPGPREYEERVQDGLHVVTAQTDYGTISWWIDAQRGWNPVRVALSRDGAVVAESRSTLREFGGVWYPEVVAYYVEGYKGGEEPIEVVRVYSASFNRPEHPQRLTPKDIGIDVGLPVAKFDLQGKSELGFFDGERWASQAEFNRRVAAGELKTAESVQRALARAEALVIDLGKRGEAEAKRITKEISGWALYTHNFIQRYELNYDQRQKAWAILDRCQDRAGAYLHNHKTEFDDLFRRFDGLRAVDAGRRAEELAALEKQRDVLSAPVYRIFRQQLKPRLGKLPTRAQRHAAEQRDKATSRPAARGQGG